MADGHRFRCRLVICLDALHVQQRHHGERGVVPRGAGSGHHCRQDHLGVKGMPRVRSSWCTNATSTPCWTAACPPPATPARHSTPHYSHTSSAQPGRTRGGGVVRGERGGMGARHWRHRRRLCQPLTFLRTRTRAGDLKESEASLAILAAVERDMDMGAVSEGHSRVAPVASPSSACGGRCAVLKNGWVPDAAGAPTLAHCFTGVYTSCMCAGYRIDGRNVGGRGRE